MASRLQSGSTYGAHGRGLGARDRHRLPGAARGRGWPWSRTPPTRPH